MKRLSLLMWIVVAVIGFANLPAAHAQDGPTRLEYGETVTGEIDNRQFEVVYQFEGSEGDLVVIAMQVTSGDFDSYLYLSTQDNEIIAQNDSFGYYQNSTIIAELPETATYLVIATRYSGRGGYGGGEFDLSLTATAPISLGTTIEGTAYYGEASNLNLLLLPTSGYYTISYRHISGINYPDVIVTEFDPDYGYTTDVAAASGSRLRDASFTVYLEANTLYSVSPRDSYYYYENSTGDAGVYTLVVTAKEGAIAPAADTAPTATAPAQ